MNLPVVILGAGPAGLGAAYQLAGRKLAAVKILEQRDDVGGNSASFELEGVWADYGSHRFHPACEPRILSDVKQLLGNDLLLRPRHGRIRLRERWIHFPLKALDMALHLPPSFFAGVARDMLAKPFRARAGGAAAFGPVLEHSLGRTICRDFYFPYARKIWGAAPEALSAVQAQRRVSAGSPAKMLRKVLARGGRFYYPKNGFGQIARRLREAAGSAGAEFLLGLRVNGIERRGGHVSSVRYGQDEILEVSHVWSTLPLNLLVRSMQPSAPREVVEASGAIEFRSMILVYLVLEQDRFTEYDAHYFPEERIPITRLSEPKNYSGATEPRGITVLCAELPCDTASPYWTLSDAELGRVVTESLATAGLPVEAAIRRTVTRRLSHAYPLYRAGYEEHFATINRWIDQFDNLITFGRQGLFAHDNTHHALSMGYAAVDCLDAHGRFDRDRWREYLKKFESHVVED